VPTTRIATADRLTLALEAGARRPLASGDSKDPSGERWPLQRYPGDLVRILLGAVVLVGASVAAHTADPSVVEVNLFRLINELPSPVGPPLLGVMQLGALGAVPVLAVVALLAGRHRLAAMTLLTGGATWGVAKLVQYLVDEDPPQLRLSHVILRGASAPGLAFPASHVAVAAALATVAGKYVGRSGRRLFWLLVALIAIARIYVGLHMPVDVIGGLALGWLIGAAINLAVGVPARGPSVALVTDLLGRLGLHPTAIEAFGPVGDRHRCWTEDGSSYLVKTIDWNRPDQDWVYRLWRLVAFRELTGPARPGSPAHCADREAHLMLLAARGGVRTPPLVATAHLGSQASLVVRGWVDATPLRELPANALSDAQLADAWAQLDALHGAGIVHRDVALDRVLLEPCGRIWLVGLGAGDTTVDDEERAADVAEMAVLLASRADAKRAVGTGAQVLGVERMSAALRHLQPLALGAATRWLLAERPELLDELRPAVAALGGREAPTPVSPARVAASNLFPVIAVGAAVYVLLPRLAQKTASTAELRVVRWPWLLAIGAGSAITYLMAAVALIVASGRPLALGRTYAVQLAATCANRVIPGGLGAAATNVRYLESSGLEGPSAAAPVIVTAAAGLAVHLAAAITLVAVLHNQGPSLHVPEIDPAWPEVVAVVVVGAALGWAIGVRRLHRPLLAWVRSAGSDVRTALSHPGRVAVVVLAVAGISGAYILALDAALRAFGVQLGLGPVAAVYLGGSAVAAVAPTPGGVGPFEAAVVTALSAYGVAAGPAVAAVIAYRLITYWLPVAPGIVAFHVLRRSGTL